MDLINAAGAGDLLTVQRLIDEGSDPNAWEGEALVRAAKEGRLDVVVFLVGEGVDIDSQAGLPLVEAAGSGHLDVVTYLLGAGSQAANAALHKASIEQEWEVIDYLLERGNTDPSYALSGAIWSGDIPYVRMLMEMGADLNDDPGNGIYLAVDNGDLLMVDFLIRNGLAYDSKDLLEYALKEDERLIATYILDAIPNPAKELAPMQNLPPIVLKFLQEEYRNKTIIRNGFNLKGKPGTISRIIAAYY